jgi:hypothetical protein
MSTVLNRNTFEILYSVNTPDFPVDTWVINPDFSSLSKHPIRHLRLEGDLLVPKDEEGIREADHEYLLGIKKEYLGYLSQLCGDRIASSSVEYPEKSGKYLSVSSNAQIKWMSWVALTTSEGGSGLTFPFRVPTKDDTSFVEVSTPEEIRVIFTLISKKVADLLLHSESYKALVLSSTSFEEVESIYRKYQEGESL